MYKLLEQNRWHLVTWLSFIVNRSPKHFFLAFLVTLHLWFTVPACLPWLAGRGWGCRWLVFSSPWRHLTELISKMQKEEGKTPAPPSSHLMETVTRCWLRQCPCWGTSAAGPCPSCYHLWISSGKYSKLKWLWNKLLPKVGSVALTGCSQMR